MFRALALRQSESKGERCVTDDFLTDFLTAQQLIPDGPVCEEKSYH